MFYGIEPFYCTIYRLQGYRNPDLSTSEEGEVNEAWSIVAENVPCRYDLGPTPVNRRRDGMVDTGTRRFYVEADIDLRNGDRLYTNGTYYKVRDSEPCYDGRAEIHHYECIIDILDWTYIS